MKTGIRKSQFDYLLLFYVLVMVGFGTLMVASSSFVKSSYLSSSTTSVYIMRRQFIYAAIGLAAMIGLSFVDYRIYKPFATFAFIAILLLMYITPFIGKNLNGATRWIVIGSFEFQPSELMKIALVLYIASIMSDKNLGEKSMGLFGFVTIIIPVGLVFISLLLQKHTSGMVIIGSIALAMLLLGRASWALFGVTAIGGLAGIGVMITVYSHARERVMSYIAKVGFLRKLFNMSEESITATDEDELYQINNSLRAIASGGLFGKGYGESIQKYLYLPESYNDFIFAIICEELGFAGAVLVIILFMLLVFRGFKVSMYCRDKFGSMLAGGITFIVLLQFVMNIAVVTNLVPVTGVALPFFSYGGTSLIMLMGSMGILLNIAKQSDYSKF